MNKSQAYAKFKSLTGTTSLNGVRWASPGSTTKFWVDAVEKIEQQNNANEIEKGISGVTQGIPYHYDESLGNLQTLARALNELVINQRKHIVVTDDSGKVKSVNKEVIIALNSGVNPMTTETYHSTRMYQSDQEMYDCIVTGNATFEVYDVKHERNLVTGQFFNYLVKEIPADMVEKWRRYGIFSKIDAKYHKTNCFYHAVEEHKILSEQELSELSMLIATRNTPKSAIKTICEKMDMYVKLHEYSPNHTKNKFPLTHIGSLQAKYKLDIGLIDGHYFIYDKETNITSYSLKNFDSVKDKPRWNEFTEAKKRKPDSFICSGVLFELLLTYKDKFLSPITIDTENSDLLTSDIDVIETDNLEYSEGNAIPMKYEPVNKPTNIINVFFDIETNTRQENNGKEIMDRHVFEYCYVSVRNEKNEELNSGSFETINSLINFLSDVSNNQPEGTRFNLIAHNIGYDIRIILDKITVFSAVDRGHSIICGTVLIGKTKYNLIDSYALIPMALKEFAKTFGIKNIKKEAFCFNWLKERKLSITMDRAKEIARNYYKDDDEYNAFISDLNKSLEGTNLFDGINLDVANYLRYYCKQDVRVMAEGYAIFRRWMFEITNIDINYEVSTIASLAHQFMLKEGCYDGCFSLSGIPRKFIQGTVVGGRCMTAENKKQITTSDTDYKDFTSLYPSAMTLVDVPKGIPKVIKNLTYDFIKQQDHYFVDITLKEKLQVDYAFPLFSEVNEDGVRIFNNNIRKLKIGKYALEDLLTYYKIPESEFDKYITINRGYYFNDGVNKKMNEVIQKLFNKRAEAKKKKDQIHSCYKLLLNSAYGKTIEKEHDTARRFFSNKTDMQKFVSRNNAMIKYWTCISSDPNSNYSKWVVNSMKPTNKHFSSPHIGSIILEKSKSIMNEVLSIAHDKSIKVYYQDTDSIFLEANRCKELGDEFIRKYGRELYADSELGKMHSDFEELNESDLEKICPGYSKMNSDNQKNVVKNIKTICELGYFLGKKSYAMKVRYEYDNNGVKSKIYKDHIRMKGVPTRAIKYKASQEKTTITNLYDRLSKGEEIEFNLTDVGVCMDFTRSGRIFNKNNFTRKIKF